MACATCSTGSPNGCQNTGSCSTGGCNKLNTYDWLAAYEFEDPTGTDIIELSFKKGARKEFFRNHPHHPVQSKDIVVVDTGNGYDIGEVSLTGELVRLQLKKKHTKELAVTNPVIRIANERDIERLNEYRTLERNAMIRARAISSTLGLDMKISDVEYRGDGRKATFYYTAEGRVDFRELVRLYAKEFQIKVEMRQIGARQESARIGGIGSCGRELCCSTWLTDFKTVNTHAARYQNLSINQVKLSGQCGRLKCCLNYELDTYMEAIEEFPQDVDILKFKGGSASLIKMDIFKKLLYYSVEVEKGRSVMMAIPIDRVKLVKAMNLKGQFPDELPDPADLAKEEEKLDFADDSGDIELPDFKKKRKKNRNKGQQRDSSQPGQQAKGEPQRGPSPHHKHSPPEGRDRTKQGPRPPRTDRQPRPPRTEGPRPPRTEGQSRPPRTEGQSRPPHVKPPNPNQPPRLAGEGGQAEGGNQRRHKNRNRGKGRNPGGERPPQNNPPV